MVVQFIVIEITFSNFQVQDGVYICTHDLQLTFNYLTLLLPITCCYEHRDDVMRFCVSHDAILRNHMTYQILYLFLSYAIDIFALFLNLKLKPESIL